jgi:dTDP-4-amino-4,6-dideoxygalactose transaminase
MINRTGVTVGKLTQTAFQRSLLPVHLHPFYRRRFGLAPGYCPNAEAAYEKVLSLPLFPAMQDQEVEAVIEAVWKVINAYAVDTRAAFVAGSR